MSVAALVWLPVDLVHPRRAQAFSPSAAVVPAGTPIPVVGVAQAQKHQLREELAAGPLTLSVSTTAHRDLVSQNVLATRRGQLGGADAPVVMVSAHYDSVIGAPGANDDGSGTGLCLEIARVLRALPTEGDRGLQPVGSEEQGLIGSRYYVAQLPQSERDRLTGAFQNDMVATSWDPATRYWLLSFTGRNNVITQAVIDSARRLATNLRSLRSRSAGRATTSPSRRSGSTARTSPGAARRARRCSSRPTTARRTRSPRT